IFDPELLDKIDNNEIDLDELMESVKSPFEEEWYDELVKTGDFVRKTQNKEVLEVFDNHFKLEKGHLYNIVRNYFIDTAHLYEPKIGHYSFNDVLKSFKYSIKEYCIDIHRLEPYETPPLEELLKKLSISTEDYNKFIEQTDQLLKSYTDESLNDEEQRRKLYFQLNEFTDSYTTEEKWEYQLYEILNTNDDIFHSKCNKYLDKVIQAMREAELNQISHGRYLVIEQVFDTYNKISIEENKERKNYLIKSNSSKTIDIKGKICNQSDYVVEIETKLNNYVKEKFDKYEIEYSIEKRPPSSPENYDENENMMIEEIRGFFFYLIYGPSKMHIYLIHSILGYKYDGARKMYYKLFLKDKSTGKADFLLHTNCFNIYIDDLYQKSSTIKEIATLIKNEKIKNDQKKLKKNLKKT
ncbi:MAG: hypothetical protein U9N59_10265, partial [Campylobacterota bacterium]|nr:hypothetical protein [Campylobacterota bacterium]